MKHSPILVALLVPLALGACGRGKTAGGPFASRGAPDEMAIGRQAPLVLPPDFNVSPPKPGAPRPVAPDARSDALGALFPDQGPKSAGETALLDSAGANRADPAVRSNAGDPGTVVVDKGATVRKIVEAPAGGDEKIARITPGA